VRPERRRYPPTPTADERVALTNRLISDYDALMHAMALRRTPQFLSIDVTMQQAKLLFLVSIVADATMSSLASRLGVSLPTATGLVDRLVEHGLIARRVSPGDRRHVHVVLTAEGEQALARFREISELQLRQLLDTLDPDDLAALARGVSALADRAAHLSLDAGGAAATANERTPA